MVIVFSGMSSNHRHRGTYRTRWDTGFGKPRDAEKRLRSIQRVLRVPHCPRGQFGFASNLPQLSLSSVEVPCPPSKNSGFQKALPFE